MFGGGFYWDARVAVWFGAFGQNGRKKLACLRLRIARNLLGGSGCHDVAAAGAAFGAEVDHPVGGFDHVEIVFDHQYGSARFDQFAKCREQFLDVVKVQAGGGLVKNIQDPGASLPREMRRNFSR